MTQRAQFCMHALVNGMDCTLLLPMHRHTLTGIYNRNTTDTYTHTIAHTGTVVLGREVLFRRLQLLYRLRTRARMS